MTKMCDVSQVRNRNLTVAIASVIAVTFLSGCNSRIPTNKEKLSEVKYQDNKKESASQAKSGQSESAVADPAQTGDKSGSAGISFEQNMSEEQAVADGVLKAWRKSLSGDDQGGKAKTDAESEAMKMLEELDKKHPGISTVQFMMGQVKDHHGKPKEAVEHYKKAHAINSFSSMQTFKLAESMRKSGDAKGSIVYYKKLVGNLEQATKDYGRDELKFLLVSVRLGLARALKDEGSDIAAAEAETKKALEIDPNNADAKALQAEIAKALQSQISTKK